MQVGDAVARVRPDVHHEARAALGQAGGLGDAAGDLEHLDEDLTVTGTDVSGIDDVLSGDHKDVGGRDRVQVLEGVDESGRQHLGRSQLAGRDCAEEAVGHGKMVATGL